MPTLNWIGKDSVVNHHLRVPFHLLKDVPALGCSQPGEGNLIVEGDNLVALKALLPDYADRVKCIYIDLCSSARRYFLAVFRLRPACSPVVPTSPCLRISSIADVGEKIADALTDGNTVSPPSSV